jgi:hypothetical protein
MNRSEAIEKLVERLRVKPSGSLKNRDYLSRYSTDGEIDPEKMAETGLNRVLFALDAVGGEEGKPVWAHLAAGGAELLLGLMDSGE